MKFFLAALFLTSSQLFSQDAENDPADFFSKTGLEEKLSVLGNDSLQGRGTGSEGEIKAAEYIES